MLFFSPSLKSTCGPVIIVQYELNLKVGVFSGQDNFILLCCLDFLHGTSFWYLIYLFAGPWKKTEWGKREGVRDRAHLSWINVLRIPLINVHTHSHSHVYPGVVSPLLSIELTFICSISFFFQPHNPSCMLSHRQLPGERLLLLRTWLQ